MTVNVKRRTVAGFGENEVQGDNTMTMPSANPADSGFGQMPSNVTINVPPPAPPAAADSSDNGLSYEETISMVEKARKEEKDKLYPQLEALQSQLSDLTRERDERIAAEQQAQQQAAEAERLRLEAEQSAVERLASEQEQMAARLDALRQEAETERALRQKEAEFAEVSAYRYQRLQEESDMIAPELVDYVQGSNRDQLDQSIEVAKAKTAAILQQVQGVQLGQMRQAAPPVTGMPPVDSPQGIGEQQVSLTPEDIRNMSIEEYSQYRSQLLGAASSRVRESGYGG